MYGIVALARRAFWSRSDGRDLIEMSEVFQIVGRAPLGKAAADVTRVSVDGVKGQRATSICHRERM